MNLFEVVKASINTQEAAQTYGIDVNHHGMALCPFHNDRHPSLYVSDDHYHCFACGEHGDVIDLTAKLFDLRLYDAARKLASDFHLAPDKPLPEAIRRKKEHKIITTRQTGGLHKGYKPKLPASASRRWLSPFTKVQAYCLCHFCCPLKGVCITCYP